MRDNAPPRRHAHGPAFRCNAELALAAWSCAAPAGAQDFYAGKQLTIMVGAGPGGGYDLQARIAGASSRPAHSGQSTIIVQNIPSRIAAANMMFSTAMQGRHHHRAASARHPARQADLSVRRALRDREIPLARQPQQRDRGDARLAHGSAQDDEGPVRQELIVGGITGVDPETTPRLYNSLIGTKFKVVTGYNSTAQIALAIERGEVQGIADWSWSSLKAVRPNWLADKQIHVADAGRAEERAGARLAAERARLHQERRRPQGAGAALHAEDRGASAGDAAGGAGGAGRAAAQGVRGAGAGQEFLAEMDKAKMEFDFVPGPEIDKIVAQIAATPPRSPSVTPRHFPPTQSNAEPYPLSANLACAASSAGSRAGSPRAMPHSVPMPSTRGVAASGGKPRRVAACIVVMHKAEIKLGLRAKLQVLQRRKVSVIGARLDHRHVEELDRPFDPATMALVISTMMPMSFGSTMCSSAGLP
jgi:hypothetical protein